MKTYFREIAITGLLLFGSFFMAACEDDKWSSEERRFIELANKVIDQISTPLSQEEIDSVFVKGGDSNLADARVIMFGENHNDFHGKLLNARLYEQLKQAGDTLLVEGGRAGVEVTCWSPILYILALRMWQDEGNTVWDSHALTPYYAVAEKLLIKTKAEINNKKLRIGLVKQCFFWDDPSVFKLDINLSSLTRRNTVMVTQINKRLNEFPGRVFVIAGARHLPMGDLDFFRDFYLSIPDLRAQLPEFTKNLVENIQLPQFYPVMKTASDQQPIIKWGFGSTEVIYNSLQETSYVELIPKHIFARTEPCGPECG